MSGEYLDENAVKVIAHKVVDEKMEDYCYLRHDKIIGCITKKFNQFYYRFAIGIIVMVVADFIIRNYK